MHIPDSFSKRLGEEFPNLRIRWSFKRNSFQIEQQIGRGSLPPIRIDPYDDDLIRAKDGYWKVCEVQPGTNTRCPNCNSELKVPSLRFAEVRCNFCISKGRDGRHTMGYFPLSEVLFDHLRKLNPLTGGIERAAAEIDKANQMLMDARMKEISNRTETLRDDYAFIAGIPSVGYTGNSKIIHRDKF